MSSHMNENAACSHGLPDWVRCSECAGDTYLNAIDPDRCAACAAWPSLPCAQHRDRTLPGTAAAQ